MNNNGAVASEFNAKNLTTLWSALYASHNYCNQPLCILKTNNNNKVEKSNKYSAPSISIVIFQPSVVYKEKCSTWSMLYIQVYLEKNRGKYIKKITFLLVLH